MFMGYPFHCNATISTFLAQMCCHDNQLPQGAPTSPVISNFICARLDKQLLNFAIMNRCYYTRYADDLTFSTYLRNFPENVALLDPKTFNNLAVSISKDVKKIIIDNGFKVNEGKIRLRTKRQSQKVTGLTVNRFPNVDRKVIRQIRAMLHAWQKFGIDKAAEEYFSRYDYRHRDPENKSATFREIVIGKINFVGMVRGKDDRIYRKFCKNLKELDSKINMKVDLNRQEKIPLIITEGSSDWKHLKAAFRNLKKENYFPGLSLKFSEYIGSMGDDLLKAANQLKKTDIQKRKTIFIFDSDKPKIVEYANDYKGGPRYWGNGVYSFCIPIPKHRSSENGVCIELYYTDDEIKTKGINGKRLFLSNEFDSTSRNHNEGICKYRARLQQKIERGKLSILDMYDIENGHSVALTKNYFADYVLQGEGEFSKFNFMEFKKIFEIIENLLEESKGHY
jgi:RNA-directed DNA polymerase